LRVNDQERVLLETPSAQPGIHAPYLNRELNFTTKQRKSQFIEWYFGVAFGRSATQFSAYEPIIRGGSLLNPSITMLG
jgi:hypothetical protein